MAPDLPDDVWNQVVETRDLDRGDLHNLSSTSRRMYRLTVPVLFRKLEFHVSCEDLDFSFTGMLLMTMLIRANMRARFLLNSPEILRHTRVFEIWGDPFTRTAMAEYFGLHKNSDNSSSKGDAIKLLAVIHDAIFRLIFRMPRLQEIKIYDIVITPLCYAAISSRPLLTTLSLQPDAFLIDTTPITTASPNALRLRNFTYTNHLDFSVDEDPLPDPLLTDILDHCILSLERLTTSPILFPMVVARIPLYHTLPLRTLKVVAPPGLDGGLLAAFFKVLHACPQLRHLEFRNVEILEVTPTDYLSPFSLPNLSTISGPPRLLQLVTGGSNIVEVSISGAFHIKEQPLTQVILSSPTHLRHLSMGQVVLSQTARELLTFIQSLSVFENLENLSISYEYGASCAGQLSWKDHNSAEDSHSAIQILLNQLVRLRFLKIHSYGRVGGYNIGCPISQQGEPADRRHPSLEGIYVDFICGMWSWDSRTGWKESNWAVPQRIRGNVGSVSEVIYDDSKMDLSFITVMKYMILEVAIALNLSHGGMLHGRNEI